MKTLTKAEEQVMMVLWKLGSGLLMEIVDSMADPKPHKNTVATILTILIDKERQYVLESILAGWIKCVRLRLEIF